jgi:hypothetical protein
MMRVLSVALSLLLSAGTASAERAWVLWSATAGAHHRPIRTVPSCSFRAMPMTHTISVKKLARDMSSYRNRMSSYGGGDEERTRGYLPLPSRHRGPARAEGKVMDGKISCKVCGHRAAPDDKMRTRPDGSRWLHYDCIAGHSFHRPIAGSLVRFTECDCDPRGPKGGK